MYFAEAYCIHLGKKNENRSVISLEQTCQRTMPGKALKTVKTVQRDGQSAAADERKTHSQVFLTEQVLKDKKIIAAVPKLPATVLTSKPAPGMYKGKIVQSKIGSIWKSSSTVQPAQTRSKSALNRPAQMSKSSVASCPPARTPVQIYQGDCRRKTVIFLFISLILQICHVVMFSGVFFLCVFCFFSHHRVKLAEWLASKGKTLKRPAMTTGKPKVSAKPQPDLKTRPEPVALGNPEPCLESQEPDSLTAHGQTPAIMNTTLDLLDNSDPDLPIVVNLCDALEAMMTPSRCRDGEFTYVCNNIEVEDDKSKDGCTKEEKEMREDVSKQEEDKGEDSDEHEAETDNERVQSEKCVMATPQMENASVVKYSVKTTPYLQSVKRKFVDEASTSACRRKSNIKDLKFLTPVRRSCRIQRKSSHLPTMLLDHDPCVTSLAELVKLDDNPNAYICRKNSALVEDLPDQFRE
uniref:Cytoskeleton-associated protein 2 C-terminal domain-containing protein n=1 Tax=Mola mola TaxID=94237 RepID=A0A3Q3W0U7_MOLML